MLTPGINILKLSGKAKEVGKFHLGQVAVHVGRLRLMSLYLGGRLAVEVAREEPKVRLDKGAEDLLSGFEQTLELSVVVGSYALEPVSGFCC